MPLFYTLIFILPPIVALAFFTGKRTLETVPFFFFGTIFYGYIMSLLNLMPLSVTVSQLIWVISVGYIIFSLVKKKELHYGEILFDIAIIAVVSALLWWLCRGRFYVIWDEMSHWGKAMKGMYQSDMLYCLANPAHTFNEYSPSVSIFQYIALHGMPLGGFREDVSMFVQAIMYACLLIWPVTKFKKGKVTYKLFAALLLMLVPVTLFLQFYTSLLMDSGLGVVFGFLMIYYFLEQDGLLKYLTLGLGCFTLTLMKTSAIGFCVILIIVIVINEAVNKRQIRAAVFIPAVCAAFTAGATVSWKIFLKVQSVNLRWTASDFNLSSVIALFDKTAPEYRLETIRLFFTNIFTDRVYGFFLKFSYMEWFALFVLLCVLILYLMEKKQRKGFAIAFGAFLASMFLFTVSVLVSYLFFFDPREAVGLASISRYLNPVLIAGIIVLISFFLYEISFKKPAVQAASLLGTLVLLVALGSPSMLPFFKEYANAPMAAANTANIRNRAAGTADELLKLAKDGKVNVYFVSQRDTGFTGLTFSYLLDPVILYPAQEASIGEKYGDWDIWTKFYTADSFEKELYDNFEYLCLFDIDEEFLQQFSSLFTQDSDMQNGSILKVEKLADGQIQLVRIN